MTTVNVGPGQQFTSIQAAVNANPTGTTFNIAAGTYHESIIPKDGDVFNGAGIGQTIIDGQGTLAYGFDGSNGQNNITTQGMTVRNFTNQIYHNSGDNTGWNIINCEVTGNTGSEGNGAIQIGTNWLVRNCLIHDNAGNGFEANYANNFTIDNCEIYNNNTSHYDPYNDTGGVKFNVCDGINFTNNKVHDNWGAGFWADTNCTNITVSGNEFYNNLLQNTTQYGANGNAMGAIQIEINSNPGNTTPVVHIFNNYIHDWSGANGSAAIWLADASNTEIYNNAFSNVNAAVWLEDEGNRSPDPSVIQNNTIHNNFIATTHWGEYATSLGFNVWQSQNNVFNNNTYYLVSPSNPAFFDSGAKTPAQWQAEGSMADPNSTFIYNGGTLPSDVGPRGNYVAPQGTGTGSGSGTGSVLAQAPTVGVHAANGNEGGAIALAITAAQASSSLSTANLTVNISGLQGATLNHGTLNSDGSYTLHATDLSGLAVTPSTEFTGTLPLTVTGTDSEPSSGTTATSAAQTLAVTVNPVAEAPTLTVAGVSANQGTSIPLSITAAQAESDLSTANLTINVSGLQGASLNHGTLNTDGSYTLTQSQLTGLTLTPATGFAGTLALQVTATDTETASNTSAPTSPQTLDVTVNQVALAAEPPTLTIASHSLHVSPGGSIPLGLGVSVPNAGDNVTVTISGLPKYETITDNLDSKTFSGSSVTLTAAEVNSGINGAPGLSLSSSYHGHGHPTATLTITATDSTTGLKSAAQTITVVDPPATTTGSGTSTSGDGGSWGQSHHHIDLAQWFNNHPDFALAATTLREAGASRSGVVSTTTTTTTDPTAGYSHNVTGNGLHNYIYGSNGNDTIDLRGLTKEAVYTGSNPVADHVLQLPQHGSDTVISIAPADAPAHTVVTLHDVVASALHSGSDYLWH